MGLTMKEANRYWVIFKVIKGHLKVKDVAETLNLSDRQIYRIKARVKEEGIEGVVHKTKGKRRRCWLTQGVEDKTNSLYKGKYKGFNLTHMTEFLNKGEGIKVSRESARQILLESGSYTIGKKHPKHRQWREPSSREGQMLQFDTSDHDWLEGRGPRLSITG